MNHAFKVKTPNFVILEGSIPIHLKKLNVKHKIW